MLFQMCYGPEILSIYEMIQRHQGVKATDLRALFQYKENGDIQSLIDITITFLTTLQFISIQEGHLVASAGDWDDLEVFRRFQEIARSSEATSLDSVFVRMHHQLFVVPDQMFIRELHTETNRQFEKTLIGREKINAWKRMMEYFGLGYRVYSGFYALPQQRLMMQFVRRSGPWEGALHQYCLTHIHPFVPCMHQGQVFRGMIYGLAFLHKQGLVKLSRKQDLPFHSYGPQQQWNWIEIQEVSNL